MLSISTRLARRLRLTLAVGASVASLALSSVTPAHAAVTYTVTDLGQSPGSAWAGGTSVNNSGHATVLSVVGDHVEAGLYRNGSLKNMGTLGGVWAGPDGINEAGMIVGASERANGSASAFMSNGTTMVDLAPNSASSWATAINNGNMVTGWANDSARDMERAALWAADGTMTLLAVLPNTSQSSGHAINSAGVVAGRTIITDDFRHARATLWANGTITDLGTLGGQEGFANGINDAGVVVGISDLLDGSATHATMWKDGQIIDLDGMRGSYSMASAINAQGVVVGDRQETDELNSGYAFIHAGDGMVNLNTLISSDSGWTLTAARGISNNGQIVGFGVFNGRTRAFMLTPVANGAVPEPASWALMLGGMFMVAGVLRRSRQGPRQGVTPSGPVLAH